MDKSSKVLVVFISMAVFVLALVVRPSQSHQQQNSATNRGLIEKPSGQGQTPSPAATPDPATATWNIPADANKTKNPIASSEESIAKGKELYMTRKGNCVFCHGETGAGNEENLAKLRRKPADLSDKERMKKLSDGELFWKITLGIPGIMPGREKQLTEEERWHVINYIRTLGKDIPMN
jgi:mono/diheme cytochrome c family protein